jgi:hypothetical protein
MRWSHFDDSLSGLTGDRPRGCGQNATAPGRFTVAGWQAPDIALILIGRHLQRTAGRWRCYPDRLVRSGIPILDPAVLRANLRAVSQCPRHGPGIPGRTWRYTPGLHRAKPTARSTHWCCILRPAHGLSAAIVSTAPGAAPFSSRATRGPRNGQRRPSPQPVHRRLPVSAAAFSTAHQLRPPDCGSPADHPHSSGAQALRRSGVQVPTKAGLSLPNLKT